MEAFAGKFKSVWSENFDEYMKKVGVGFALRKMAEMATPVVEIFKEGEMWHLKTTTTFKTTEIIFKLGEEFDETTGDGRLVKSTITIEDGKMYHRQKATKADQKDSEIIRWMEDADNLTTTVQCEDVKSTRKYKREP